jgi:hypothetical protein
MKRHLIPFAIICASFTGIALTHADDDKTQPTTQPTTAPSVSITWDKAKDHADETAAVTGPVIGDHSFDNGAIVLNIGKNFPEPDRFTVYITGDEQAGLPQDHYVGKTITATGKIIMYHNVPEIKCGTKDIRVVPTTQP